MATISTRAHLLQPKNSALLIVFAVEGDEIKKGGMIEELTVQRHVFHNADEPLEQGDVCKRNEEDQIVRCGHL